MARAIGPKKVQRYTAEFKLRAVKLSNTPNVKVNDVAEALDIHPFMLSRWRKEVRDGKIKVLPPKPPDPPKKPKVRTVVKTKVKVVRERTGMTEAELERFANLKRKHAELQEAHDLLKKYIRFYSERNARSSRSSTASGTGTPSATSAKSSK
jgi:transposase